MQALRKREGSSSRINLKKAGIIVLESASIYAILLFFSIIFQSAGSNIKNLTISLTVPGIGESGFEVVLQHQLQNPQFNFEKKKLMICTRNYVCLNESAFAYR